MSARRESAGNPGRFTAFQRPLCLAVDQKWRPFRKIMRTDVQTIGPDESVRKAAFQMRELKIGCLPVVENGRLVGILTGFDLVGIVEKL